VLILALIVSVILECTRILLNKCRFVNIFIFTCEIMSNQTKKNSKYVEIERAHSCWENTNCQIICHSKLLCPRPHSCLIHISNDLQLIVIDLLLGMPPVQKHGNSYYGVAIVAGNFASFLFRSHFWEISCISQAPVSR